MSTADDAGAEREKVVSKLPPWLRKQLKVRAAELGVDIQNAVTTGIANWRALTTPYEDVDTSGAESFSTWLPEGLYDDFKADCADRSVSYVQGLAQSVSVWLAANPSPQQTPHMPVIVIPQRKVVCNQKGGVGKTAVTAGLGAAYAEAGHRVLIVDYDPQGHLSKQLGVAHIVSGEDSLAKYMASEAKGNIRDIIVALDCFEGRLHVLPSCADAFLLDVKLSQVRAREAALERALTPIEADYDVIIIDCPPSLGLATDAGLYYGRRRDGEAIRSSGVLIPVQAEDSSADAYGMLINQIDDLRDDLNIDIDPLGLVVNLYDSRKGYIATSSLESWRALGDPPVVGVIPELKEQREAVRKQLPLLVYAPKSEQAEIMRDLTKALTEGISG
jgi:cellulose biosynthesis protein BcsQ